MTDLEIRKSVEAELNWEPSVHPAEIGVAVKDGVVALTGEVASYWEKAAAERAASRVAGVRGLANDLEIRLPFESQRDDADLATAAVNRLDWSVTVPKGKVKVKVSQGWLTLEGSLDWQFQKEAAEDAVRSLLGVKGVSNFIAVKPPASAAEVKGAIVGALKRSAQVDANRVMVEADGGKVTLRGTVKSWYEREEAQDAAWRAPGVRSVDNRIEVAATTAAGA